MLYPLLTDCETQPLVPITNLTLRNISSTSGWLPPGIIRCNETNPCTGFVFDNVNVSGWFSDYGMGYITENVYGTSINSFPDPGFLKAGELPSKASKFGIIETIRQVLRHLIFDDSYHKNITD